MGLLKPYSYVVVSQFHENLETWTKIIYFTCQILSNNLLYFYFLLLVCCAKYAPEHRANKIQPKWVNVLFKQVQFTVARKFMS